MIWDIIWALLSVALAGTALVVGQLARDVVDAIAAQAWRRS